MFLKCSKFPCCLNIDNEFLGVFSYVNIGHRRLNLGRVG